MGTPYKQVLVPLDGSIMAEAALSDAMAIAKAQGAEVTLLEVIPPVTDLIQTDGHPVFVDEQIDVRRGHALEYLDRVRHRLGGQHAAIHVAVEMGPPADGILDYAAAHAVDLIVMATHGRSGLKRWVLGSVAEKIVRGAAGPVLLVRPERPASPRVGFISGDS